MKNINFYGINLEKMSSDELTKLFARIKEEIEWHKFSNGNYPQKMHVYASHLDMMADKNPSTHCVICI